MLFCCQTVIGSTSLFFMTYHVTGAGVEYDPKQQATAEFIDNKYEHVLNDSLLYSMVHIQSWDKIL